MLLSGFRSRCDIVTKGAFPTHRVHQGLEQLIQLYCLAGFDRDELNSIPSQILNFQIKHTVREKTRIWSERFFFFLVLFSLTSLDVFLVG